MTTPTVDLNAIVEAMDSQSDETSAYLNRETGEVAMITEEAFAAARHGRPLEEYPAWMHNNIRTAQAILEDFAGVYVPLPTPFEIHEWQIMDRFAFQIEDEHISETLQIALRGRGAFRRFKDAVHRLGVAEQWYAYRDQALKQIALEWCEANGIPCKPT